ncbi:MAG: V-type ATPase subunit, partial [Bacillota bacterium]|nr:V-type ATPase subunit [Bacillota bacterium]
DVQAQEYLLAVAEHYRAGFLRGYLQREADLLNLQAVLRAAQMGWEASTLRRALLPGGALPCAKLIEALETAPRSLLALTAGTEYQGVVEEGVRALEQAGQLGRFALLRENFLHSYVRAARHVAFGYVPVLAYALAKEREGRLLRLVFTAKLQALPLEKIAERLDALCPGSRSSAIKIPSWAFGPSGSIPSRFGM